MGTIERLPHSCRAGFAVGLELRLDWPSNGGNEIMAGFVSSHWSLISFGKDAGAIRKGICLADMRARKEGANYFLVLYGYFSINSAFSKSISENKTVHQVPPIQTQPHPPPELPSQLGPPPTNPFLLPRQNQPKDLPQGLHLLLLTRTLHPDSSSHPDEPASPSHKPLLLSPET